MIISISNQKGGVGKTTTAVNLAGGLALQGYKTLLIDIDPQANATIGILGEIPLSNLAQVFTYETTVNKILVKRSENFSILPSSIELEKTSNKIAHLLEKEFILKNFLKELEPMDFIIIDTPPNFSLLSQNAWTASDKVIIPVQPEYYALHGLNHLISTINEVKARTNPSIKIMGILLTMYDDRKRRHKESLEVIKGLTLPSFKTIIRTNSKLYEAPEEHKTIQEYDKSSSGTEDYNNLIKEILQESGK